MGCGGSKEKVGNSVVLKKGKRVMAPYKEEGPTLAVIMKVQDDQITVYYPEHEPPAFGAPEDPKDMAAWLETAKGAKAMVDKGKEAKDAKDEGVKKMIEAFTNKKTEATHPKDDLTPVPFPLESTIKDVQETKLEEIDALMMPLGAIIKTFKDLNNAVFTAYNEVTTLEEECAPFGIVEILKQKLSPVNTAKALKAILAALMEVLNQVPDMIAKIVEGAAKITELVGEDPTDKLKEMCEGAGLNPMQAAKSIKTAVSNIGVFGKVPALMEECTASAKFLQKICKAQAE
jgi:hypothetical protein